MSDKTTGTLKEFKDFILQGDVVMLAVAVVIGLAFQAVIKAVVADILTPLIAAIFGKPNFAALTFEIHHSTFHYGDVINYIIEFLFVGLAIFFLVVKPYNAVTARTEAKAPTTRPCPACLTDVPLTATRCPACTSTLPPVADAAT